MSKKLYVGNLPFSVTQEQLKDLFAPLGEVTEVTLIVDKATGRSRGFGFVTITDDEVALKAISEMNGKDIEGRQITVSEARPMGERSERRPFRPRGGGGGGRGRRREFDDF
ncbi:RNA recognition motif. (a.k.a. RRM, RBD, or RNP domain) [Candidatus Bilamarchaeum dharawalense]|uniref:RNA recognition motif. (A.k.a. RRM, RBD, or RNP domain) n=1 Tax=Candidatus Bilamarchaeum dharawalense TaxID=2885759 RepID=A0A5E4LQE9_9ARCH|nr:RNA recognition motif. (a.k.a. RRM, RBD, or RNP domain) [Candidatus Bilamarchaeum dharawalense]